MGIGHIDPGLLYLARKSRWMQGSLSGFDLAGRDSRRSGKVDRLSETCTHRMRKL